MSYPSKLPVLRSLLRPLPKSQSKTVLLAVQAIASLAQAASLAIAAFFAQASGSQIDSALTRFYRLLHNPKLDDLMLTRQMLSFFAELPGPFLIAIDWTEWHPPLRMYWARWSEGLGPFLSEQVKVAGGEMVFMPEFKYVSADIPQGLDLKTTKVFGDILNADVLIDVPIAKHHSLARLTLGMKNLMGLVKNRNAIHTNLGQRIADLTSLFRPTLTVIDAVRVLMAHGPTGGDLNDVKQMDTVIVSPDIVAADSYAASFFGLQPEDVKSIRHGGEMGLGRMDLSNLKIEEIQL